jgi:hypothetical protein
MGISLRYSERYVEKNVDGSGCGQFEAEMSLIIRGSYTHTRQKLPVMFNKPSVSLTPLHPTVLPFDDLPYGLSPSSVFRKSICRCTSLRHTRLFSRVQPLHMKRMMDLTDRGGGMGWPN